MIVPPPTISMVYKQKDRESERDDILFFFILNEYITYDYFILEMKVMEKRISFFCYYQHLLMLID